MRFLVSSLAGLAGALTVAAAAASAFGGPSDPQPEAVPMRGLFGWIIKPNVIDASVLADQYVAFDVPSGSKASVRCEVGKKRYLTDCVVLSEEPAGKGVGKFAIALAGMYKAESKDSLGQSTVGRKVVFPFVLLR
jgi:hypothetical protein